MVDSRYNKLLMILVPRPELLLCIAPIVSYDDDESIGAQSSKSPMST